VPYREHNFETLFATEIRYNISFNFHEGRGLKVVTVVAWKRVNRDVIAAAAIVTLLSRSLYT